MNDEDMPDHDEMVLKALAAVLDELKELRREVRAVAKAIHEITKAAREFVEDEIRRR